MPQSTPSPTSADRDPAAGPTPELAPPTDAARRDALAKLGALAAWTAPVMLTLTLTPRTSAASPPGLPGPE